MSKVVDQRVVEMQFDNRNFERNVSTTMSTLDKLKQSFNFKGAEKGFQNLEQASRQVNFKQIENAAYTSGFSIQDVWLKVASVFEYQVAGRIVSAASRMAKALTIEPITTGLQEYETQINAVQTILANTESKGTTIDDVNRALEELNKYADMTIYNFTEMTRNIGTFTAAGVELDVATNAIKGIANLAAVSGSTSQQASTAMYQLSQAMASGSVKLMDWNSVVNAGMGGQVFQDALKETARVHGVAIDDMISKYGSFRETLKDEWLTTDILTETLEKFTMATEGATEAEIAANREKLKSIGYTDEQIDGIFRLGNTATNAATKVKTFTQLWDVMKEAAQSGWAQTWKIIIGDFEEAKALLTPLSDFFTGVINSVSNVRNTILEKALGSPFADIVRSITDTTSSIGAAVKSIQDYSEIVDRIIRGDFGVTQERWDKLTEMGYNWAHAQNLVNEKLGNSHRYAVDLGDAQSDLNDKQQKLNQTNDYTLAQLARMAPRRLKELGLTNEQIEALKELNRRALAAGISLDDAYADLDQLAGRTLLINSFKNIGKMLIDVFNTVKTAWQEIFPPKSIDERAEKIYNIIAALHKFSLGVVNLVSENGKLTETGEKLVSTFKGVFAILDIVATLASGGLRIAFNLLTSILGYFHLDILDVTAAVGDAIVKFRDWVDSAIDFDAIVGKVAPTIENVVNAVRNWIDKNVDFTKGFQNVKGVISEAVDSFRRWIDSLKEAEDLPKAIADGIVRFFGNIPGFFRDLFAAIRSAFTGDISINAGGMFSGLVNGLKIAGQVVVELGKMLLDKINGFLSAHGMQEISADAIAGLLNGLKDGAIKAGQAMIELGKKLIAKIKEILGIHSPSTVFFAIGGFIIAGLIAGLLAGGGSLGDAMKNLGDTLGDAFGEIDFRSIFSAIISAGLLKALLDISSAIKSGAGIADGIADAFDGIGDILQNASKVVKNFGKVLKSMSMSIKAEAIKDIAIALLILVAAFAVLTLLDTSKFLPALGALAALVIMLGGLFAAINVIGKTTNPKDTVKGIANMASIGAMLLGLSLSLVLIAAAVKILETIDPDKAAVAFGGLAGVVIAIAGVIAAYGLCVKGKSASNIKKLGSTLLLMSASLLIMTYVIKQLGEMEQRDVFNGVVTIAAMAGIMVGLTAMTKLAGNQIGKVGSTLLSMSAALLIMTWVMKLLGEMDTNIMIKGGVAIIFFGGIMTGLVAMTKLASGNSLERLGATLLSMSVSIAILALVAKTLGEVDTETLVRGTIAVAALGAIITGLVAATKLVGDKDLKRVGSTLLMMSISIGLLAVVAALLGTLDVAHLAKGIAAVTVLGAIMSLMIWATKSAQDCKGSIMAMAVAIGVMAVAVMALSFIDGSKLAGAVAAIGVLMLVFSLLEVASGKATGSLGVIIVLTIAVAALAGVLYLLSGLPVESTIGSAVALSLLVIALSATLLVLSKISTSAGKALLGVVALTAMAVPLLAFVGVLALMQNIQNATTNATVLIALATVMSALLVVLSAIGLLIGASGGMALLGVVGLLAMAIPMLAFVGVLALMNQVENAAANAELLIGFMEKITGILVVLAVIGPLLSVGVAAVTGLSVLMVAIGALAVGIGALMEKFPQLKDFLDNGIVVLEKIAYAIGSFVGNLVAGFTDRISEALPKLGSALSAFMENATQFIEGAKLVDSSVLEGVGILAAAIIALTAADFISGVSSFLQGGSSFADLGTELSTFIVNAMPFLQNASMITEESVAGVKALADMILTLTKANLVEGLTSWFAGETSLADFGEQLVPFGEAMANFSTIVSGNIDEGAVMAAANAGKIMAEMAKTMPNSGGWLGAIMGENDIDTFGKMLVKFGESMVEFSTTVSGNINEEAVTAAANAGKTMVALAETLPNSGGVVGWFMGENDIDTFGRQLVKFGKAVVEFSGIVSGGINEDAITSAANAGKIMSELANTLPNSGGVVGWFSGDNDIETFGYQLVSFGESIRDFADEVAGLDEEAVTTAANAGSMMAKLADTLPSSGGLASWFTADNDLSTFGSQLVAFGTSMKNFSNSVTGIDSDAMHTAITECNRVAAMARDVSGIDFDGLSALGKSLKKLAEAGIDEFISAFEDATADVEDAAEDMIDDAIDVIDGELDEFLDAGEDAASEFADGIEEEADDAIDAAEEMASNALDEVEGIKDDFYDAGEDAAKGFADGIDENTFRAEASAAAMAQAALNSAKNKLDINSPSKETRKLGRFTGLGFVKGIDEYRDKAGKAGRGIAEVAKNGLSDAISKIRNLIDSDMDTQPTIRPVLDLSDIRSGAGLIGDMFGANPSVGVMANVGAINSMMNGRGRTNTDIEVVSAINKLRKDIGNLSTNQYNINGITYDDGSNIASAIKAIARQAKIEGRV